MGVDCWGGCELLGWVWTIEGGCGLLSVNCLGGYGLLRVGWETGGYDLNGFMLCFRVGVILKLYLVSRFLLLVTIARHCTGNNLLSNNLNFCFGIC